MSIKDRGGKAEVMKQKARALEKGASEGDPAELGTTAERRDFVFELDPERGGEVDDVPADPDAADDPIADDPADDGGGDDVDVDDPLDEDDQDVEAVFEEFFESDGEGVEALPDGGAE
jgi:hypothetical protein